MKKIINLLLGVLLLTANVFAQDFSTNGTSQLKDPVTWKTHVEKINDKEFYLVLNANIEDKWHLYSQYNPDGASLPMDFSSEQADSLFTLDGKALESKTHTKYNKTWKKDEIFFDKKATFKQKITLLNPDVKEVTLALFGQACITSCILVDGDFKFDLTKAIASSSFKTNGLEKPNAAKNLFKKLEDERTNPNTKEENSKEPKKKKGLLGLFFLSFFAGFAALLTPCVFPMIPMTVSFFTKQSKSKAQGIRNAIIYGLSIIIIYVLLGTVVVGLFGADSLNILAANPWFNLVFFILLVVFAVSFLGAFEIMLPNSWANKMDSQADRGGIIGIIFMALALAVVSFSCTGPIVGTALVSSATLGGLAPIVSMFGFGLAIALPFALFAAFPGWLNSLPKSGGWLNTVKVFLGFLELALAFKFLSNADLVWDLHMLEREVFISIWIAIFSTLAFYLFGKLKLPHDSDLNHISVGRLMMGLLTLTFVIYLIPGLWGAPLKVISGFPPPIKYSESPYGVGFTKKSAGNGVVKKLPKGAHLGPHDIVSFEDYEEGLAYAKKVNKPLFIDFTGKACVNCRKMEDKIWSEPSILQQLQNDVVLVSLYVDIVKPLPKEEQYVSKETGKKIKTYGNKWSDLQITKYKSNAQPYYIMVDENEKSLNGFAAYDPDPLVFENWLEKGVKAYKK